MNFNIKPGVLVSGHKTHIYFLQERGSTEVEAPSGTTGSRHSDDGPENFLHLSALLPCGWVWVGR